MPVAEPSRMAAQVTSKRSADADCTTTRPMTADEPPSDTLATQVFPAGTDAYFANPRLRALLARVAQHIPLPTPLLDILIAGNVSIAVLLVLLYAVDSATEFDKGWISTAIGVAVILVPANQEFDNPLTLTLVYGGRGCDVPQPTTLDVFRLRTNPPHGHQLVQNPVSDEAAESITVEVDHFTTFSIAR